MKKKIILKGSIFLIVGISSLLLILLKIGHFSFLFKILVLLCMSVVSSLWKIFWTVFAPVVVFSLFHFISFCSWTCYFMSQCILCFLQEKFLEQFCEDGYKCSVKDRKKSLSYKHLCKFPFYPPFLLVYALVVSFTVVMSLQSRILAWIITYPTLLIFLLYNIKYCEDQNV